MKDAKKYRLVVALAVGVISLSLAMCESLTNDGSQLKITHESGKEFAGSRTCKTCHASIFESHVLTAHYLTSSRTNAEAVEGSFESPTNILELNSRMKVVLENRKGKLFQVGVVDGWEINAAPMDITIGSGRQGQTYLYWNERQLYQLPVSFYAPEQRWCNSPGYPADQILFNRKIPAQCLECHGTYLETKTTRGEETFEPTSLMYGVDCERCHGPAAEHVDFHFKNPGETEGQHVINPATLTRQQRLDNCALCHSGIRENIKPSFSFITGDKLEDYSKAGYSIDSVASLDVHGNQYGLLTASECFKNSGLDCSSCHDVHKKDPDDLELHSKACMTCHTVEKNNSCSNRTTHNMSPMKNCIDCHMPELPSSQVFFQVSGTTKLKPYLVRTHRIAVYKEESEAFIKKIRHSFPVKSGR